MDNIVKNTQFDNLVNYETGILSNSSLHKADYQSSSDPNALSAQLKNSPLVEFTFAITAEQPTIHAN
ncbi:MAG: hypothetical protein LBB73_05960 [Dysgonamonadaceae bacterium]|jgi:hypothetical protein|nr:hypothetical protein [Dysgonamonadaceae bacterium]